MLERAIQTARLTKQSLSRPRSPRTTEDVVQEYSQGWAFYGRQLEKCATLNEWLRIKGLEDSASWTQRDGKLLQEPVDTGAFYRQTIKQAINTHFMNVKSLCEFGCGVGRNLLWLKSLMPAAEIYGYELCEEGVHVAQSAAAKFGLDVQYRQLDYLNISDRRKLFGPADVSFTCFSLEQIPTGIDQALANILDLSIRGTVHLEPVPENYPITWRGLVGRIDHWKVNYLRDFDAAVRRCRANIVERRVLGTSHNPLMYPSIYVLQKR